MKIAWRIVLIAVAMTMSILPVRAQSRVEAASRPLRDGVPEIAVTQLRALLRENLSETERANAVVNLAEALIAAGRPNEALNALDEARVTDAAAKFWRAQALAALQRWADALPVYEEVSAQKPEASFGAAEMLRALGRLDAARARLTSLTSDKQFGTRAQLRLVELDLAKPDLAHARGVLNATRPQNLVERTTRRLLEALLELAEKHPDRALGLLEGLLQQSEGTPHGVAIAALFAVADAHLQTNTPESGDDVLEDFVDRHPDDVDLARIFAKLDELYRAERKPVRSQLERWTREPEQPRRALAQWTLGRLELRGGRRERAVKLFGDLRASPPQTPVIAPALVDIAQMQLEDRQSNEALATLEAARALSRDRALRDRIDLLAAQVRYESAEVNAAADLYERVGYSDSGLANMSIFNAAIGRLQTGDAAGFSADYAQLEKSGADPAMRAELRLEQALAEAAKGDEHAPQLLRKFARDFSDDARVSEAFVALAELAFHRNPPALDEARNFLAQAAQSHPNDAARERADYLTIWIEEAQGDEAKVIEAATRFLSAHERSTLAPEARMKLAETYYRRQDFANAQTQFETLAQRNPNGPLAEKALFFGGESAMSSMAPNALENALVLFDRTVQLKADLRWAARNEQAGIERRLGKPRDALLLYDEVLKSDARPSEKREALCGKGDVYFEMGAGDAKNYELAIAAYDQLAQDSREPGNWHNQALFKKATCLQKKGDREGALSIFYNVVDVEQRADRKPELFWFYKAGFNAARLLEEDAKWASAAAVYDKLVAVAGPRSDEAKARLNSLRLEHFLWQE
jgi:outer membrane protein assembly factor BamD (BamD/ComL family)